ncbi:glutamyl-Q tRNA(Asp) synthetase [Litoreibacter meonggei]|uniref:Glutamyl-Q tRNA(Asp) synthetase n=1 Tax=Litoreibacter meonggei TaxID=1049199 RepID=A0A497VUG7_9RHOB|nr:tRNA glutamyl-Q(34) synthetase GluQRS [Litoreibacter meonggei]RLJ41679.1 glutamyl-Q tRNA(Asp) synthetase [Litoreibacter meonggei]
MTFRTRFAPSPTGPLHLGHAYSALLAYDMALAQGGEFLLRIEDIDRSRARPEWEQQIYDDLEWLGLWWPEPVIRQSHRLGDYARALETSKLADYLYPCTCSRADIKSAISAPQEGVPQFGPDGQIYPGICRPSHEFSTKWNWDQHDTLRLNIAAIEIAPHRNGPEAQLMSFKETGRSPKGETGDITFALEQIIREAGDIVLRRKDMGTSYHLSVVLDDAAQGISHVVRGQDLFEATKIHVLLQRLLGLPTPVYHHHKLIRDGAGKRLAKRDDARALFKYRAEGYTSDDIRRIVGLPV